MRRSNKHRRNSNKTNNNRTIQQIIDTKKIIMSIIFLIFSLFFSTIFALANSINEKILPRIQVNGIDLSNLTIDESYQKLNNELKEKISQNLIVKSGDYELRISLEQLEVHYDIQKAINEAYKIGRNKNIIISNYQILKSLLLGEKVEIAIIYQEEQLNQIIEDIQLKLPDKLKQVSYYIEEDELIIVNGTPGKVIQKEELKEKIIKSIKERIHGKEIEEIEIPVNLQNPEQIEIEKIYQEIKQDPQNAYYEKEPFTLHKEKKGIDFAISIEQVKEMLKETKEEYIIPLTITDPEMTIEDIKYDDFFPNQLSKYITRYDETNSNRSNNIRLSSEKINGLILMPGETFSYNKVVGERTIKAGYKEAAVYVGGKVVNGIGGGICQVSSTLYNAVLQANLEILSRRNHYFITSYVSPSRDATVSFGSIDFQFKNNRTYPIQIECISKNGICQINIKGIKEEIEYDVEIQDQITEVIPYTTKYIDTKELTKGQEEEIQKGVNGYKSKAYKILKLNGAIVSKTLLSKDSYNPLQRIVKRGI